MPILDTPITAPMSGLAGRQDAYMRILSWEATMTRRRNKSRLQRYQESWFFYIGENICITVVDIDRGKIRLGVEAPRDVPIYREELLPLKGTPPVAAGTPAAPR